MTLAVTHCPDCKKKLQAKDSRPHNSLWVSNSQKKEECVRLVTSEYQQ